MPRIIPMPDNTESPERDSSPLGHNYCNKTQRKQKTNMEPEIEEILCTSGSVGWAPGWYGGGREFDSSWINTQGLKITEEKVLPL